MDEDSASKRKARKMANAPDLKLELDKANADAKKKTFASVGEMLEPFLEGGEQVMHSNHVRRKHVLKGVTSSMSSANDVAVPGTLLVTNFRVLFVSDKTLDSRRFRHFIDTRRKTPVPVLQILDRVQDFALPLGTISRVEKWKKMAIRLHCKDFRLVQFTKEEATSDAVSRADLLVDNTDSSAPSEAKGHRAQKRDFEHLVEAINSFAFPKKSTNLFAFCYYFEPLQRVHQADANTGWRFADLRAEYKRMGIPSDKWRICEVNANYELSETYPSLIVVPASVNDEMIKRVGPFRSKGRIPILSWVHPKNGASITRASQPLVGISKVRSEADERLMREIILTNPRLCLRILDARPKVNARANLAKGAGYERVSRYGNDAGGPSPKKKSSATGYDEQDEESPSSPVTARGEAPTHSGMLTAWSKLTTSNRDVAEIGTVASLGTGQIFVHPLEFLGIDNIHVMRDSERRLRDLCFSSSKEDKSWFSGLEHTRWLEHIGLLLMCTSRIVDAIDEGISVFTHCSDGWDRTSQLTGLSMLCLDPYYRTIDGFAVLIQKEWLAIGHKFAQRYGQCDKHYDDKDRSPIFPQFIDAVWQIMQQFPTSFQFNQAFLVAILDAVYSCQFGTFLFNTEKERRTAKVQESTISLWTWIEKHREQFTSRSYVERVNFRQRVLKIVPGVKHLTLWNYYYLRYCQFYEYNQIDNGSEEDTDEEEYGESWVWYQHDRGSALPKKEEKKPVANGGLTRSDDSQRVRKDSKAPRLSKSSGLKRERDKEKEKEKKKPSKKQQRDIKSNSERLDDPAVADSFLVVRLNERLLEREKENEQLKHSVEKLKAKSRRRSKELKGAKQQIDSQLEDFLEMKILLSLQRKREKWLKGRIIDSLAASATERQGDSNKPQLARGRAEVEGILDECEMAWEAKMIEDGYAAQLSGWGEKWKEPDELGELLLTAGLTPRREGEETGNATTPKQAVMRHKLTPLLVRRPSRTELIDRNILKDDTDRPTKKEKKKEPEAEREEDEGEEEQERVAESARHRKKSNAPIRKVPSPPDATA